MAYSDPEKQKEYMAEYYQKHKGERKTKTSSAVKNRYNAKTYKNYRAAIKPDLFDRIEQYSKQENLSRPEFLRRAIETLDK